MPNPIASNNPLDWVWGLYNNIVGFPGRVQGMVQNAVINTIDQMQTAQALKETREIIEREERQKAQKQADEQNT